MHTGKEILQSLGESIQDFLLNVMSKQMLNTLIQRFMCILEVISWYILLTLVICWQFLLLKKQNSRFHCVKFVFVAFWLVHWESSWFTIGCSSATLYGRPQPYLYNAWKPRERYADQLLPGHVIKNFKLAWNNDGLDQRVDLV